MNFPRPVRPIRLNQNKKRAILIALVVILFLVLAIKAVSQRSESKSSFLSKTPDDRAEIKPAKASQTLNREFLFPLSPDDNSKNLKYILENAELRDEIVVKGQRATSVKGRTFLIINLKLVNELDQAIEVNTKNYLRLSVNGNESEWLAPDIHNDPVQVQAISTKLTRLGFPINDTDKKLVLQVGEINGNKEKIELKLQ